MFGHPKGLFILFFTELWERFSYYGMRAILVLYMVSAAQKGGLGWSDASALEIYGWYVFLVYAMSIPGGIIADRYIGQRKAVMLGGILLCAGHILLAYTAVWAFFTSLALIILGVGLLKPNISTMVGSLYGKNDPRKDAGFTIFYMGINIGAFLSGIAVGFLADKYGWHYGFGLAGIGMIIGQIVYMWGQKHLGDAGLLVRREEKKIEKKPLAGVEKKRLLIVFLSFFIVLIFWAAFEQAGGLMNLYTERFTDRSLFDYTIPTAMFQSLNPLFIMLLAPVVAWLWVKLGKIGREPSAIAKMGIGTVILGIGFIFMVGASLERGGVETATSGMHWLVFAYLFHTIGELALSPVSLSFITKMAPKRMGSQIMGLYFAVTGLGGMLAAKIGIFAEGFGELAVFGSIAAFTIVFGALVALGARALRSMTDEETEEIATVATEEA